MASRYSDPEITQRSRHTSLSRSVVTDQYSKTVAFVFVGSTDLNKELLKAGLAWHYKHHSRDPELPKLEFEARSKKVGLWKEPDQIARWEWRKMKWKT
jgi:endonuclease YncB( thermonuclease family)